MAQVERRVVDREMVKLLRSGYGRGSSRAGWSPQAEAGTPQGSPVSPLLANIALHVLDEAWAATGRRLGTLVRYCDDFVVLCPTQERAERRGSWRQRPWPLSGCACTPTRPRSSCLRQGRERVRFLGLPPSHGGVLETQGPLLPAEVAVASGHGLYQGQGQGTDPRGYAGLDMAVVVEGLNPVLRGWGAYFRYGNSARKFNAIDGYVHQRLAKLASVKHGLRVATGPPGSRTGWLTEPGDLPSDRDGAPLGCECLTVNDVGKPCAGEPHARFDRGPLARRSAHGEVGTKHPKGNPTD